MKTDHLLSEVIIPTLQYLNMDSAVARYLLLGTAAQESHMGRYLVQLGGGPALGIYQMEPATHDDIWQNYLAYRPSLVEKLDGLLCSGFSKEAQLSANLFYATAMARIHYRRVPEPLPKLSVIQLTRYWKKYYNTYQGKGKVTEFKRNFRRFVGDIKDANIHGADSAGDRLAQGQAGFAGS